MTETATYLLQLNVILMVLYAAYRIFFEKDSNFKSRRLYLLAIMLLSILIPLVPEAVKLAAGRLAPVAIPLDGITIYAFTPEEVASNGVSAGELVRILYLGILGTGLARLLFLFAGILRVVIRSEKIQVFGKTIIPHADLHASSFFGFIFMDPALLTEENVMHILDHEAVHQREWHSVDRLLAEVFCTVNWFNPLVWLYRRSIIQNLEYLADSAVVRQGTDARQYQISMISQHIGSASITNQFSSQLKKRIIMLNRNHKRGSGWKLALIIPFVVIALVFIACSEKEKAVDDVIKVDDEIKTENPEAVSEADWKNDDIFYIVEDMPTFNGGDPSTEFRKYIAEHLIYPNEASENGVSGKIFIRFVVTKTGKVEIPDEAFVAKQDGKSLDEVVVVAYRTLKEDAPMPEEKYIQLLKDEVIRVVSSSPDWEPGMQRGTKVNVMFTFPITFALQ